VVNLREENVQYFTEAEEKFANLLIDIGMKKNIARLLVFFANTPEATSRQIERGIDIRQPDVSIAIRYLTEQNWIACKEIPSDRKGRPQKSYSLTIPLNARIAAIEKEKKDNTNNLLARVRKLRDFL
jgi:predicted transcriptional regulator